MLTDVRSELQQFWLATVALHCRQILHFVRLFRSGTTDSTGWCSAKWPLSEIDWYIFVMAQVTGIFSLRMTL